MIIHELPLSMAANNSRSTDNVRSDLGIDRTNLWMARHVVRSLTDSLREILVFNYGYLIIIRGSIHVSERKKNEYKTRQTSGREIPGCRNFHDVIKSCCDHKSSCLLLFYLITLSLLNFPKKTVFKPNFRCYDASFGQNLLLKHFFILQQHFDRDSV